MTATPDQQAALDRLETFYDGDHAYNPNTYPGAMRAGGNVHNFVPALRDVVLAFKAAKATVDAAIAAGVSVSDAAAIAQPLLDQAIARLNDALQAVADAEAARDRAEAASGVVTGDLQAKFEGLLPGLPIQPPLEAGKMWLDEGIPTITMDGLAPGVTPTPHAPIVHLVTSDELDAHKRLTRALSFAFH